MGPYLLILIGLPVGMVAVGKVLGALDRYHGRITGLDDGKPQQAAWMKSMRGERERKRRRSVLDTVMIDLGRRRAACSARSGSSPSPAPLPRRLVDQGARADVDRRRGHRDGRSEATNAATLPTSSSVAARPVSVCSSMPLTIASRARREALEARRDAARPQRHEAHAVRAELGRELPPHRLDRVEGEPGCRRGSSRAAGRRSRRRRAARRLLPRHVARGGARGQERRAHRGLDRAPSRRRPSPPSGCPWA